MNKNLLIAATLVAGIALGYGVGVITTSPPPVPPIAGKAKKEREILYWVAPMDANYKRDKPGKSPMGMDLVPVYADEAADSKDALRIDPAVVNNIGVRTATAETGDLAREINTVGYVAVDENKTSHVHVRTAGWIEKLYRKAEGEQVKKGELIFELYSPELVNAQAEYVQALRLGQNGLIDASRDRLAALGMDAGQIDTLKRSRKIRQLVEVRAPQDGVILALPIAEGMYVKPATTVFSLADLSVVWVKVDVFESQAGWVKKGQPVSMTLDAFPGETLRGTVDYIYPLLDAGTRTLQVRLAFDNKDGRLRPNMYGEIIIEAAPVKGVVTIPREALIRTGKMDRVILALGGDRFRPAEVIAGMESGDRVAIRAGLKAGEDVVTSGQFLIDSEASANSALTRLLDPGEKIRALPAMATDPAAPKADAQPGVSAMGTLKALPSGHKVTLAHGPIKALGWPAMTMDFDVAEDVDLSGFKVGDRLHFTLKRGEDGRYVITHAMKM
ncbi:efflux RND transporter periplasmic adaptor subunit [Kordiimonas marina]|uniref:efflux RND transporter periplasmic adaptor subunit n=1 Tax=Kordiimonas marina TaxID=2872312 RepID=UPI001FF24B9D|nr:efflux RND transporter periplasmic adaptor subunit [Kordiimonas marina]MCJ9430061.1 efflux RND transporter periplasmic adaptor subunit [Kordiimonas marina]